MLLGGRFQLERALARGGMGTVWAAHDRLGDRAVVVKVLHPDVDAAAVRHELAAVASLAHPGIVEVLDVGGGEEAWFAMERLRGPALSTSRPGDWPATRDVLARLLEALAHAHARGIVHGDLKPANVLLAVPGGPPVLVDFGVATVRGRGPRGAGTPRYMAPEQLHGDRGGPWTDVYALGVMALALVGAERPWHGLTGDALIAAKLTRAPPELAPRFPVPPELATWVRGLLAPDPGDRPESAAAALGALPATAPTDHAAPVPTEPPDLDATMTAPAAAVGPLVRIPLTRPTVGFDRPPLPAWEDATTPAPRAGIGLGLFGLRRVPLVGRRALRDVLWSALRAVLQSGEAAGILLVGEPGIGRSRLATWLAEHASATGAVQAIRLERAETAAATAALRAGRATPLAPVPPDATPWAVLAEAARAWPLVVVVDDAPAVDALLARAAHDPAPVLLVAVASTEAAAAVPRAQLVPVPPLPVDDRPLFVRHLLGLTQAVAAEVERRSAGFPGYAVALVGRWARSGALVPTVDGYAWRDGTPPTSAVPPARHGPAAVLAALLDDALTPDRWRAACRYAGVDAPPDLPLTLAASGLARLAPDGGWRLSGPDARDALLAAGVTPALHRACARALTSNEAVGRHLAAAGDTAAALDALVEALQDAQHEGHGTRTRAIAGLAATQADALDLPPHHPVRLEIAFRDIHGAFLAGNVATATRLADAWEPTLDALPRFWQGRLALMIAMGRAHHHGDRRGAVAWCERALANVGAYDSLHRSWICTVGGYACLRLGDTAAAKRWVAEGMTCLEAHLSDLFDLRAQVRAADGDTAGAIADVREALARVTGRRSFAAATYAQTLGDLLRHSGDLVGAADAYATAARHARRLGALFLLENVRLNQAFCDLEAGRTVAALRVVGRLEPILEEEMPSMMPWVMLARLACTASRAGDAWLGELAALRASVEASGLAEPDLLRLAEIAAREARAGSRPAAAVAARAFADAQRRTLTAGRAPAASGTPSSDPDPGSPPAG